MATFTNFSKSGNRKKGTSLKALRIGNCEK